MVTVRAQMVYTIEVHGTPLGRTFQKVNEMVGMQHLKASDGESIVIDIENHPDLNAILGQIIDDECEFQARVVKGSSSVIAHLKELMAEYAAQISRDTDHDVESEPVPEPETLPDEEPPKAAPTATRRGRKPRQPEGEQ